MVWAMRRTASGPSRYDTLGNSTESFIAILSPKSPSSQAEAVAPDVWPEVVALGHGVLPRLVLRPPVRLLMAEAVDEPLALLGRGVTRLAAAVVVLELRGQVGIVVAVDVHGDRRRQPHADPAGLTRIADAHAGHREDAGRQLQELTELLDVVAHHADRTAA